MQILDGIVGCVNGEGLNGQPIGLGGQGIGCGRLVGCTRGTNSEDFPGRRGAAPRGIRIRVKAYSPFVPKYPRVAEYTPRAFDLIRSNGCSRFRPPNACESVRRFVIVRSNGCP